MLGQFRRWLLRTNIRKVGTVSALPDGRLLISDWHMTMPRWKSWLAKLLTGEWPAAYDTARPHVFCGYTFDELMAMAPKIG